MILANPTSGELVMVMVRKGNTQTPAREATVLSQDTHSGDDKAIDSQEDFL